MTDLAKLKARLIQRAKTRASYAGCHDRATAYRLGDFTGWNKPSDSGARIVETLEGSGLRLVGYADEILPLRHTGWYTDENGMNGEKLRGCVLQLPARNGRAQYLAAYQLPNDEDAYRVDIGAGIFAADRVRDAARAADHFAEHDAEQEREHNEAWQAGSRYAELGSEIAGDRKIILDLCREMKAVRNDTARRMAAPTICETLRRDIREFYQRIQKARGKRDELKESVWRDYYSAFNEGAGETVLS